MSGSAQDDIVQSKWATCLDQETAGITADILAFMIIGAHFLLYSNDADADRAFFRDILGFRSIDIGRGWLIFSMPPAEAAIHPMEGESLQSNGGRRLQSAVLYLMCDDLNALVASLKKKSIECGELVEARWGVSTTIPLPSGGEIGLYQPSHPTALNLDAKRSAVAQQPRRSPKKHKASSSRASSSRASSKKR